MDYQKIRRELVGDAAANGLEWVRQRIKWLRDTKADDALQMAVLVEAEKELTSGDQEPEQLELFSEAQ